MSTLEDRNKKLGQLLVEKGWITGEQLIRAIQSQRVVGGRIGTCLLEMDVLSEDKLLDALSSQLAVPAARIDELRGITEETVELIPPRVADRWQVVPFFANRYEIKIATLKVHDLALIDEIQFCTNKKVIPHIANEVRLFEALEKYYGFELPRRYGHLLDRLNRSRYMWDESAKILLGNVDEEVVWTSPEEMFEEPSGLLSPASGYSRKGRQSGAVAVPVSRAQPVSSSAPQQERAQQERAVQVATLNAEPVPPIQAKAEANAAASKAAPVSKAAVPTAAVPTAAVPTAAVPTAAEPTAPVPKAAVPTAVEATPAIKVSSNGSRTVLKLEDVDRLLGGATDPSEIGEIVLRFAGQTFTRSALFRLRRDRLSGWRIRGSGADPQAFERFDIDSQSPSAFVHLNNGSSFYRGPLAPMPVHRTLAATWGGELPSDCLLLPITVRDRLVSVFYGDRGPIGLGDLDVAPFHRLASQASMAFELCIMRKKLGQP